MAFCIKGILERITFHTYNGVTDTEPTMTAKVIETINTKKRIKEKNINFLFIRFKLLLNSDE